MLTVISAAAAVLLTTAGAVAPPPQGTTPEGATLTAGASPRATGPLPVKSPEVSAAIPGAVGPTPAEAAASTLMRYFDAHPALPLGEVRLEGTGVAVIYKGQIPAAVRALAARATVPVRFMQASYSWKELTAEARRVAESNQSTVASIGPSSDYSGLVVEQFPQAASRRAPAPASAVPLTIQGTADPAASARNGDTSPFYGGALMFRPTTSDTFGVACTSGWPVFNSGVSGLTTAWHCGTGNPWRAFDGGAPIGNPVQRNQSHDIEVIRTSSAAKIYIGAWNSAVSRGIYNAERPANNSGICLGGGVMGERCNKVYVRGNNVTVNVSGVGTVGPGYWALNEDVISSTQQGLARGGDSGGPSYSYISTSQVSAKGIIVAIDKTFSTSGCGQQHPSFAPPCYSRAFMSNAVDAFQSVGSTLRTGP